MLWLAIVKLVSIGYAARGAWRARFAPAWALALSFATTVIAPAVAFATPDLSVLELLAAAPAVPLVALAASAAAGTWATRRAFRALDGLEPGSPAEDSMSSAAYGSLGNSLLDTGLLLVVGAAVALAG